MALAQTVPVKVEVARPQAVSHADTQDLVFCSEQGLYKLRLHVSSMGLLAARVAFSGECDDWLAQLRTYLTANRDYLVDYVTEYLPDIRITRPDATYLAWLDCRVVATHVVGDHTLYIGEVVAAGVNGSGRPLLYWNADYRQIDNA